jgi:HEAT repeat protein
MSPDARVKLLLAPTFGRLQAALELLRALPWPRPLQRLTKRGLERLSARIPELAALLQGPHGPARGATSRAGAQAAVQTSLPDLLALLAARDYRTRTKAVQALAGHREEASIEALIGALRDRSVEVAVAAAATLSAVGGARAQGALLAVLENRDGYYHSLTRASAGHGLGARLTAGERQPLEQALRDSDAEVSIAAISAWTVGAAQGAAAALLPLIENADGFFLPITRVAAARSLDRLPPLGTGELERLRAREADPLVGELLERQLGRARGGVAPAPAPG